MMILLLDTSDDQVEIMLACDNKVLGYKKWSNGPGLGGLLLGEIDELLERKGVKLGVLNRIGVKVRSGKRYSALRSGIAVATMLSYAKGADIVTFRGQVDKNALAEVIGAKPEGIIQPEYVFSK